VMAQPLLDFLEGRARQVLPYLRKLVSQGLSSHDIQLILGEFGLGLRRTVLLDIIAALKGARDVGRYIRLVGENTPIPLEGHAVAPVNLSNNYSYLVEVENGPVTVPEFVTVTSAIPLSANQIFSVATGILASGDSGELSDRELAAVTLAINEAQVSPSAPLP
jgi:hypothetical protein